MRSLKCFKFTPRFSVSQEDRHFCDILYQSHFRSLLYLKYQTIKIESMNITRNTSMGDIVAQNINNANVLNQYNLDFCCGGDQTLATACLEKNIDVNEVIQVINSNISSLEAPALQFNTWRLDLLIDYIVKYHHHYIRTQGIETYKLLEKVCQVHGEQNPSLFQVKKLMYESLTDLHQHLDKEEIVLFPFIHELLQAEAQHQTLPQFHCGSIENPISVMMSEHDGEGERFRQISELTNSYTPPSYACNSYQLVLHLLKEFEQNLHIHIHVENNILFPKSIALQYKLSNK